MIGDEKDSLADPHRAGEVPTQIDERAEQAAAVRVDPDLAGRTAAIPFPFSMDRRP